MLLLIVIPSGNHLLTFTIIILTAVKHFDVVLIIPIRFVNACAYISAAAILNTKCCIIVIQ